jgi:hypothetical protein
MHAMRCSLGARLTLLMPSSVAFCCGVFLEFNLEIALYLVQTLAFGREYG